MWVDNTTLYLDTTYYKSIVCVLLSLIIGISVVKLIEIGIIAFVDIFVLYGILHIKKKNVSAWANLE
jgi:hypothetical protein